MVSQQQKAIINATLPAVEQHAVKITSCFYPLMFRRYPSVLNYFNQANQQQGTQREALANAVVAYAKNLDRLDVLSDAVSLIVQKHCSLGILPEHYPIVGECLLAAIAEVLGDAVNDAVLDAWGAAYQQLAEILIGSEQATYQFMAERQGGWNGLRDFEVIEKRQESEVITSLVLAPIHEREVIDFHPGQYITIVKTLNDRQVRRSYSLSSSPGQDTLQISVKREDGGTLSNHLHDDVQPGDVLALTAPCGDFTLNQNDKPLVLVTAGVGITPALSMLEASLGDYAVAGREIHFLHCARNGQTHAFGREVRHLAETHAHVSSTFIYSHPTESDLSGETGLADDFGFLTETHLKDHLGATRDVELYVLGPKIFMQQVLQLAADLGIPEAQTHFEFFGPLEELAIDRSQHAA